MVSYLIKCKNCGKERKTHFNRFKCCKMLQDVTGSTILTGLEIKKRQKTETKINTGAPKPSKCPDFSEPIEEKLLEIDENNAIQEVQNG